MIPKAINLNLDVPIEIKARGDGMLFLMNISHKIVTIMSIFDRPDGNTEYHLYNTFPLVEISGGLAYYEYGWKICPIEVQEKYVAYIAEREILGD